MSEEELIDDQYQLVMCIANGSSSQVWEVVEKSSARHLAMKLLKKEVPEFKENKAQLRRESEILKAVEHPLIVKFDRYSSNRDHTYMLMEHFRASNLKIQIKNELNKLHLRIRQLFEGICTALAHVHHKGFVHRDIKPDNVLMNKAGEVRLCDFSLSSKEAKGIGKMLAGRLKSIQGTRTYIAPETIRRQQPTLQTDLYSLGVLFYEVLTARTPFQAPTPEELLQKHLRAEPPNPSEFNPNVTPEMDRIISKLLKKKPADRPNSTDDVLAELKRIRIFKEDVADESITKKANEDAEFLSMASEIRLDSRADAKLKEFLEKDKDFAKKFRDEKVERESRKAIETERQRKRVEAAEKSQKKKPSAASEPAAAPAPVPQPQPMMMPMPMPMPMYQPGFPGYPPGYGGYPQAGMPQPMPPGVMPPGAMPVSPGAQFPPQPQAYAQAPVPPNQAPPMPQQGPPPARPAVPPAAVQPQPAQPPARQAPPKPQTPAKPPTAQPPARQTPAGPAQAAPRGLASPIARPVARATPATAENADLEFMTELPDVM